MSKHDDDFGAVPRIATTARRPMTVTPFRAAPVALVARPATLATPQRRPLNMSARPMTRAPMAALSSPSARPSFAPDSPVSALNQTPAALAAQAFGPTASTSSGGGGSPPTDSGVPDASQQSDWSAPMLDTDVSSGIPAKALATVPAVKESFWSKLLALFGFGKKAAASSVHGEPNTTRGMVESVVRRARNGDQNAMALIALVRDNAKQGNGKAQQTFALLQEYVRTHPVGENNPRIVSGGDATFSDAVALSHGPMLTNSRIDQLLSRFSGEQQEAIHYGMANKDGAENRNPAVRIGKILAHARRLQAVRMRGSSLGKFDPRIGWELDE